MSYNNYNYGYGHRHKPQENGNGYGAHPNSIKKSYGSSYHPENKPSSGNGRAFTWSPFPQSPQTNSIASRATSASHSPRTVAHERLPIAKSLNVAKNELSGTDVDTGINSHDEKFPTLMIHSNYLGKLEFSTPVDSSKTFKVVYDPELDKTLSKAEKKSKHAKLKFRDLKTVKSFDPRLTFQGGLDSYLNKPNKRSKKFPFKQLPQTKFVYNKDSLGPAPLTEIVIWELPTTVSEIYMSNYFKTYGNAIKDLKFINDSVNGVPLGIATFEFQGKLEKSARLADKVIKDSKESGIKMDGVQVKVGLNDHDSNFLNGKIRAAEAKLKASLFKLQEEKKKRAKLFEEEQKRQKSEEQKRQKLEQQKAHSPNKLFQVTTQKEPSTKPKKQKSNITITSIVHKNKVVSGVFLPTDLNRYIKDRPFIFIRDKYIPTKRIASSDIKRVLNKYSWTRVLSEREGFFIVFNSLKECERCFYKEDGVKFYEYSMIMEMCIPEGFYSDSNNEIGRATDVVNEAANMLIKDFETYLTKDIRERIIAPVILDLLSDDKYPTIMAELKAQEAAQKKENSAPLFSSNLLRQEAMSLLASKRTQVLPLPSFRKKPPTTKAQPKKRALIPMSHALNYDVDSDESEDESSRSMTPVPGLKRQHSSAISVTTEAQDEKDDVKHKKIKRTFLYQSSEDDMEVDGDETEAKAKAQESSEETKDDVDYSQLDEVYQPTFDFPRPVYETRYPLPKDEFDIEKLKDMVKDEEDYELLKEVLSEQEPNKDIKNIQYWAWKMREEVRNIPDIVQDDEELILPLDSRLESTTGSFKSDGYKKISDQDKIEYLPHRRKVDKPLKTIQNDDDDMEKSNQQSSNIHSSRVNRANNRRFAADISAQKQAIGSETDILSLNTLAKRKKPVSFARSAIHNWGLYALEPIAAKEMIIEYVGESIRQQVAEHRERSYLKTGIGSSYLFRIDENTVIDATKKGGIARFINHCCSPSCTAKIIKVDGKKRIVIYALRDIEANEELTYDYKFERETNDSERIRCLCGAPGCKGYLN
ncbi:histone H3-K4 methyltransferase Set1 [Yamadazyma tenuis ATCC 10573]|uniref:Histone-lysine N-methyltransferase, H3 lysine-4 specific n=1 Tax=Candida tenuis (strain ATCC 10573 / BCRC 21748 / CBS 615 / JCM 9827 / NBRC 10315 / NRRL Y-1498 / VKM Y-70) TaxID=590646 RepID=G3BF36_CANTC|nr:histone H3-K4 methyltransferase Set1 [Yamadazyma tenuis ATCC 10573]EGV60624.1 histone H3-K4 methyltransferase Set1 [Yamadazyma tenuis ATCC 10573]